MFLKKILTTTRSPSATNYIEEPGEKPLKFKELIRKISRVIEEYSLPPLPDFSGDIEMDQKVLSLKKWYCTYLASTSEDFRKTYRNCFLNNQNGSPGVTSEFAEEVVMHVKAFINPNTPPHEYQAHIKPEKDTDKTPITDFLVRTSFPLTPLLQTNLATNSAEVASDEMDSIFPFSQYYDLYCGNTPKICYPDEDEYLDYQWPITNGFKIANELQRPDLFAAMIPKLINHILRREGNRINNSYSNLLYDERVITEETEEVFRILDLDFLVHVARRDEFTQSCHLQPKEQVDIKHSILACESMIHLLLCNSTLITNPSLISKFSFLWESPENRELIPLISRLTMRNENLWIAILDSEFFKKCNIEDLVSFLSMQNAYTNVLSMIDSDTICQRICFHNRLKQMSQAHLDTIFNTFSTPCIAKNIEVIKSSEFISSFTYQLDLLDSGVSLMKELLKSHNYSQLTQLFSILRKKDSDSFAKLWNLVTLHYSEYYFSIINPGHKPTTSDIKTSQWCLNNAISPFTPWIRLCLHGAVSDASTDKPVFLTVIRDFLSYFLQNQKHFFHTSETKQLLDQITIEMEEIPDSKLTNADIDYLLESNVISTYVKNNVKVIMDFLRLLPSEDERKECFLISDSLASLFIKKSINNLLHLHAIDSNNQSDNGSKYTPSKRSRSLSL